MTRHHPALTGDSSGTVNIWARWARRPSNRASVRISVPWLDGKEIVLAIIQSQEVLGEITRCLTARSGRPTPGRSAHADELTSGFGVLRKHKDAGFGPPRS
jgi:hypothetical protein